MTTPVNSYCGTTINRHRSRNGFPQLGYRFSMVIRMPRNGTGFGTFNKNWAILPLRCRRMPKSLAPHPPRNRVRVTTSSPRLATWIRWECRAYIKARYHSHRATNMQATLGTCDRFG